MFALPFVFAEAGFLVGGFYVALFAFVFYKIHRMYAEVIEYTKGRHRFVGYVNIYLEKWGVPVAVITTVLGLILALTAYISVAGEFVNLVLPGVGGLYAPYIFWLAGSFGIILSFRRLARFEFAVTLAIGLIVIILFALGLYQEALVKLPAVNVSGVFLPYGVVLFALSGRAAISSLADYYERRRLSKEKLYHAIGIGTAMPAVVYVLFALAVFWLSGGQVSQDALSGLAHLHPAILALVSGLGILALWTSYFFLGIEIRDICRYDLKLPGILAIAAVALSPIALYSAGIGSFIELIGIAGGVFLAVESILVVFLYSKIKGWRFWDRILVGLFALGALYVLLELL
jgi:amino acid permease